MSPTHFTLVAVAALALVVLPPLLVGLFHGLSTWPNRRRAQRGSFDVRLTIVLSALLLMVLAVLLFGEPVA